MNVESQKPIVLRALRHLLGPIVRVLLQNGVTWNEFAEIGKEVFVDVARAGYGIQGRPTNNARVALITGLNRREVTRVRSVIAGATDGNETQPNRISQILTAWHTDPDFLDADGKPVMLAADGSRASLAELLKRYAGDVPHGALLKELTLLGLVKQQGKAFKVVSRHYVRSASDPDLLHQAGQALHDHATTLAHNVDASRTEPARFERMATTRTLPRRHLRAFGKFLESEGEAFLERADAWLATHSRVAESKDRSRKRNEPVVRAGVGVYSIQDHLRGSRQ
jgi:hypothetical protein